MVTVLAPSTVKRKSQQERQIDKQVVDATRRFREAEHRAAASVPPERTTMPLEDAKAWVWGLIERIGAESEELREGLAGQVYKPDSEWLSEIEARIADLHGETYRRVFASKAPRSTDAAMARMVGAARRWCDELLTLIDGAARQIDRDEDDPRFAPGGSGRARLRRARFG